MKTDRILLVDDDANILTSLTRQLHRHKFIVHTAQSGPAGLEKVAKDGPFSVIVSDYRMPGMDGVEFLSRSQKYCPETSRIMLTGSNEVEVAISAVNRGNIFRFLLKPLSPEDFILAITAGAEQYRLIIAEKELMEELSVLQQIDRELNTNLDTAQAMSITLEWALTRTNAIAGLVGAVIPQKGIRSMASKGFSEGLSHTDEILSFEKYKHFGKVVEDGDVCFSDIKKEGVEGLHAMSKYQVIVPIRREHATIGVLLLEGEDSSAFSEDSEKFLTRLCDHASIAITNSELYAAARAANQAKNEFISFATHELRNPLTAIAGFTELMHNGNLGPISESQRKILDTVKSSIQRMVILISDLGDIARIESGLLRLESESLRVQELVDEVIRSQQVMIEKKNQTIQVLIPEDLPLVYADRMRTLQVFTNILSNANKYSPEGGMVRISAEACANLWDKKGARKVVHIWVEDNGIGLTADDQKKIFQKFFRSDDSQARLSHGTGMGLNITKSLVEVQGGRIWFESEFRKGTTFHFTIPIVEKGSVEDSEGVNY